MCSAGALRRWQEGRSMADLKFPLFLDLTGKTAVMVGGGRIALRRTRTLAAFDVRIRVIAPEICEEIRVLSREGKVECIPRAYEPEDLSGAFLVLAATDDPDLNRSIVRQAKEMGLFANNASDRNDSNFFFPAVAVNDSLSVGICGTGRDHGAVARAAAEIRKFLKERGIL